LCSIKKKKVIEQRAGIPLAWGEETRGQINLLIRNYKDAMWHQSPEVFQWTEGDIQESK
jgi:hypothetical protein